MPLCNVLHNKKVLCNPYKTTDGSVVALTKDMLSHAYLHNYEVAVLVSGDGDYVPVLEELKRLGKLVCVASFIDEGFNDKLRLASDFVSDMTSDFLEKWKQAAGTQ